MHARPFSLATLYRAPVLSGLLGLFGLLGALVLSSCGSEELGPRHNVVLISIDTMRPDYLGCYGRPGGVSPALDRVAAAGVVFEDVTSASPWTLPSHASMLTGMYPATHGVRNHEFALEAESLGTWLAKAGYQTMAIVNTHNVGNPEFGLMRGFEPETTHWAIEMDLKGDQVLPGIKNRAPVMVKRVLRWLKNRDESRPFFLFFHSYDVHTDFTPDAKWREMFVDPYESREVNGVRVVNGITDDLIKVRNRMGWGTITLEEPDVRHLEQLYDAEIRTFDEEIGKLFDYLDASGLAETTLVAITSDHGEEYNEHGGILHGRTHYQELIRIPWILRGPGVPAGAREAQPVHLVDVAPTLLSLAGVPIFPGIDGIDASLTWRDPAALPGVRYLFSEADHNNVVGNEQRHDIKAMVRLENDVLHYDKVTKKKELYDLAADPFEQNDLAAEDPERVEFLFSKLEAFMAREGSATDIGPVSAEDQEWLDKLGYGGESE